jgi:hypothetical protein
MTNAPQVESLQNKQYFEHNKSITAGHYYHQNNYHQQFTLPKIVKLDSINPQNSKVSVKIGFTNFHHAEPHICINRCKSLNLLYLIIGYY